MESTYNLKWLIEKFDTGESLKFLFFWGHTNKANEEVGNFCFSQWYELPFVVDRVEYKTAEHWMMANKALLFDDPKMCAKIIHARSPAEAKKLGRQVSGFDDNIWNTHRLDIVVKGNIHKFNQHPKHAEYLINTKDRVLVEASPFDKVWGIGLSKNYEHVDNPYLWKGQNLLGFALMEARDFLAKYGHFTNLKNAIEPPWKAYPDIHPMEIFWRMGHGEDVAAKFFDYYTALSDQDKIIFKLTNPVPYNWTTVIDDDETS